MGIECIIFDNCIVHPQNPYWILPILWMIVFYTCVIYNLFEAFQKHPEFMYPESLTALRYKCEISEKFKYKEAEH